MNRTTNLSWKFKPPSYFEAPFSFLCEGHEVRVGAGSAEVDIPAAALEGASSFRDTIASALRLRFEAVRVLTHQSYELESAVRVDTAPDGTRHYFLEVGTGVFGVASVGQLDFVVTDSQGRVVRDSRQERIAQQRRFAELITEANKADPLVAQLLAFYGQAVEDRANELIHLYDIVEAIEATGVIARLGVSGKARGRLGKLANRMPLRQGRHRGQNAHSLRDATDVELEEARKITLQLIEGYAAHVVARRSVGH